MDPFLNNIFWASAYIAVVFVALHKYFTWNFNYFLEQGIRGPKPIPVFGNSWKFWKRTWPGFEIDLYREYGKIYGTFEGRLPHITIGCPKIYKRILKKDAENFSDRLGASSHQRPYMDTFLSASRGKRWRSLHEALTVAFSSEEIYKWLPLMNKTSVDLVDVMKEKISDGGKKVNILMLCNAFALDIIGRIGFGSEWNCLKNPRSQFTVEAADLFPKDSTRHFSLLLGRIFYPRLLRLIPNREESGFDFFAHWAKKVVRERKRQVTQKGDFIGTLFELADGSFPLLDDENVIVGQMLQFLISGYREISNILACGIQSLALDEEIQEKLRKEIKSCLKENGLVGLVNLSELPYLNLCLKEILRMYGPAVRLERYCNKTTKYDGVIIRKGVLVSVPIYAIHHDPELFPNPDVFNPDRFIGRDDEGFFPFGAGSRSCISTQFALHQLRIALAHLLINFKFDRIFETADPLSFRSGGFPPTLEPELVYIGVDYVN